MTRLVISGVAGSGKTTIGRILAADLGARFLDADDLHPPENIAKMRSGQPLTHADREPWLESLAHAIADHDHIVAACSALTRRYRDRIRDIVPDVIFVFLDVDADILARRLAERVGHFMPRRLLESQLATLEPLDHDEGGLTVTNAGSIESTAATIQAWLRARD